MAEADRNGRALHWSGRGAKADEAWGRLLADVQRLPQVYKREEWWDKAEGDLPNADVSYPSAKRAAAFVCTENRCSLPIFAADQIAVFLKTSKAPVRD